MFRRMVFSDASTELDNLIAYHKAHPLHINRSRVHIQGEDPEEHKIYSPQLPPYEDWVAQHPLDESQQVGLLESGSLDLTLGEEQRQAILRKITQTNPEDAHTISPTQAYSPAAGLSPAGSTPAIVEDDNLNANGSATYPTQDLGAESDSKPSSTLDPQTINPAALTPQSVGAITRRPSLSAGAPAGSVVQAGGAPPKSGGVLNNPAITKDAFKRVDTLNPFDCEPSLQGVNSEALLCNSEAPLGPGPFNEQASEGTYITVRREHDYNTNTDYFCLVEVSVYRFAQDCGYKPYHVVIALPATIDGLPIRVICAGAFRRLMTSGIDIRAILLSDTVEEIRSSAFAGCCARNIYIPASVTEIGSFEFTVKKRAEIAPSINIVVDECNQNFESRKGSLYTKGGKSLIFQAWPYPRILELPKDLQSIEAGAFVSGALGPEVILCPESIRRVKSKPSPDRLWNPDTLWCCAETSPVHSQLNSMRPLTIKPGYVEQDGFYYDIQPDGTAILARSPGVVERVFIPQEVEGHAVVACRDSSLPRRCKALSLPDGLKVIGPNNFCTNLTELYLPASITRIEESNFRSRAITGIINIPASLHHIGTGCFEAGLVRFEATNTVVQISPNLQLSSFTGEPQEDGIPFDFASYDAYLCSSHHVPNRVQACVLRLVSPYKLQEATRTHILEQLNNRRPETLTYLVTQGQSVHIKCLADAGFFEATDFDTLTEELRRAHRMDAVLFCMDYKQKHFANATTNLFDEFDL